MADERLRIVIDAMNKASDDLKKVKGEVEGVDDALKNTGKSSKNFGDTWAGVMTGINSSIMVIQQVWQGLKKVYEVAREGADLLYVEDRFDRLSESVGVTADLLMNDLREATRGVKSDAELMAGATDFMALGLAKSREEVIRLTNVAGALDMNMNQLVLTLTNKTTMRFDALGVAVDGFDDKVKALEASGLSAEDAFSEAFLQQAEEQIEKVGHVADSAAGSFDRLEAATANMSKNFKTSVATIIAPAIDDLATKMQNGATFIEAANTALDEGVVSQREYNEIQKDVRTGALDLADAIEYLQSKTDDTREAIENARRATDPYSESLDYAAEASKRLKDSSSDTSAAISALTDGVWTADEAMQSYNDKLLFSIASQGLTADEALVLAESMGLVDQRTVFAADKIAEWSQMLDDEVISVQTYNEWVAALNDQMANIKDRSAKITITTYKRTVYKSEAADDFHWGADDEGDNAAGGNVTAGNPYNWQEYGYGGERFVPSQDGFILSRSDAARIMSEAVAAGGSGKGGNTYNLTMPTTANPNDVMTAFEIMEAMGAN